MRPATEFIRRAHNDKRQREELDTHLKLLVRTGALDAWHGRDIVPGEKWKGSDRRASAAGRPRAAAV